MTKPFESIRQLFGRVLGGKPADEGASNYSTLGITGPEVDAAPNGNCDEAGFAVENSQPEIDLQTADTQRLPLVAPVLLNSRNGKADHHPVAPVGGADEFGDALLDLGDVSGAKVFASDDPLLDVLDEATPHENHFVRADAEGPAPAEDPMLVTDAFADDSSEAVAPVLKQSEHLSVVTETFAVEVAPAESEAAESAPQSVASPTNFSELSPEAIDAIARRVVAQLSDKAVREIAWEVVPELSELLIKQKLDAR